MNKFRKNNKNDYLKYGLLGLLFIFTIGFALFSANLNITGTSSFFKNYTGYTF